MGLEQELSNVDTMHQLISKLPWVEVEKWSKFLDGQGEKPKAQPFETFLKLLEKAGGSWEIIVTSGVGQKEKSELEHHSSTSK